MSKHNLTEYHFSKEVLKDFPVIKKELENTTKVLYKYKHYACVQHVLAAAYDSLELLNQQYDEYKKVYERKGEER